MPHSWKHNHLSMSGDLRVNQEKRTRETRKKDMIPLIGRKKLESAWARESMLKKNNQNLSHRVETLEKNFQEGLESIKNELKDVRAELQKNQGNKEEDIAYPLESFLKKKNQELSHKVASLEKESQEGLEAINHELKDIRAELEKNQRKKEEDIVLALKSFLRKKDRQLSHRFETLEKDFLEGLETIKHELNNVRAELKKNQVYTEEDIAFALERRLNEKIRDLSLKTQTLEEDIKDCLEWMNHKLKVLKADLKKKKGNKEEESAEDLEFKLNKNILLLSHRIKTLAED
ncbi:uncharacterized protein LOC117011530 isoform X2 [Catharus ustulatus]|uniref:uncharacterized protein LOC117011530 isoform X2 n=1 Tax=Catharus ustulatus TaxID=91951 RepID=UPI0014096665|nr:uncharacterized protein LOC117011530 isoform X2 [Catharus ustulatus]